MTSDNTEKHFLAIKVIVFRVVVQGLLELDGRNYQKKPSSNLVQKLKGFSTNLRNFIKPRPSVGYFSTVV